MPDLSIEGVKKFWWDYRDPMVHRVVDLMELAEPWILDGETDFEVALQSLSQELDHIEKLEMSEEDGFVEIANALSSGRALRLLQILDIAKPGCASKMLSRAEEMTETEDDRYGIFLRRNVIFERLRLISRIFSPDRFKLLLGALDGEDDV